MGDAQSLIDSQRLPKLDSLMMMTTTMTMMTMKMKMSAKRAVLMMKIFQETRVRLRHRANTTMTTRMEPLPVLVTTVMLSV